MGSELAKVFTDIKPYLLDRGNLDITDKAQVDKIIDHIKPDLIINAAGYTAVDDAEDNKDIAMAVNGHAVGYIAKAAKKHGATVVHYSTDYIFEGDKKEGYREDDKPAKEPPSIYGASKLMGERELQKNTDNFYLIRTSWVFGPGGKDFIDTVLRLSERGEMRIKNDEHGKPTYAKDLAQATRALVFERMPYGTYHIVNEGPTNWHEYAQTIVEFAGKIKNWPEEKYPKIEPVSAEEFAAKAPRPSYSILLNTKFVKLRPWQEALEDYLGYDIDKDIHTA